MKIEVMARQILITILLLMVWINHNIEAVPETGAATAAAINVNYNVPKVRQTRSIQPIFSKFIELWNAMVNIQYLYLSQKNETNSALQQTYDILADGFTDTATKKPQPIVEATTSEPNATTTTTTERYRISRKELGYILGKNYRGLQKLFKIEWNDAINQSKYNIQEYKQEKGVALYPYTIPKEFPDPKAPKS